MLKLSIASTDSGSPALPDAADPTVQVWQENDGTVCAYGYTVNGQHWMHFPGLASFRFSNNSDEAIAFPQPPVRSYLIRDTYYRSVLPMALQVLSQEVLHASAIRTSQGAIAFCATSETGKSTIAYGLSQRGYPLWADDAVALEISESSVWSIPLPFAIRLRSASAEYFGCVQNQYISVSEDIVSQVKVEPAPLAALCVLERAIDAEVTEAVEIHRISPIRAFPLVLAHAYCFSLQDMDRKQRMVRDYMNLVMRVPVFTIHFSVGLEKLSQILDGIEEQVINGQQALSKVGDMSQMYSH